MHDKQHLTFTWWDYQKDLSPHVLLGEEPVCGIYILEFTTGERYVGRALNIASRITQHLHGGKHHPAWQDLSRVGCTAVAPDILSVTEKMVIADQLARGYALRNVVHNMNPSGVRPLDLIISHDDQQHWATGGELYVGDIGTIPEVSVEGPSKLKRLRLAQKPSYFGNTLYDAVLDDLAMAVIHLIPNAMQLEGQYWSISDAPSTVGGRFGTLNVGNLEIMFFPRFEMDMSTSDKEASFYPIVLNGEYDPAVHLLEDDDDVWWVMDDPESFPGFVAALAKARYSMCPTRQIILPTGALKYVSTEAREVFFEETRSLVLQLMRKQRNTLFNRHHSKALTSAVYQRAREMLQTDRAVMA